MKLLLQFAILFLLHLPLSLEAKDRKFEELEKAMADAAPGWIGKKNYKELQRKFIDTWSEGEIATAGKELAFVFNHDEWDPVVERWGRIDHETALKLYLDYYRDEVSKRSDEPTSLSSPSYRELGQMVVGMCLERVLVGWAEKAPRSAWAYLIDPKGRIAKEAGTEVFHQCLSLRFVARVAAIDPDLPWKGFLALKEFQHFDTGTKFIFRAAILEGMAAGLPGDTPWEILFARLPNEIHKNDLFCRQAVRGPLLGRWLESDSKAAMAWFQSPAGEIASKKLDWIFEEGEGDFEFLDTPPNEVVVDADLSDAASYWLKRDPGKAMEWIKGHPELIPGILKRFGNSYDPSDRKQLRILLMSCLNLVQRESLLEKLLERYQSNQIYDESLKFLVGGDSPEKQRNEIAELQVSDELAARISQALDGNN